MFQADVAYPRLVMDWIEVGASETATNVGPDIEGIYLSHVEVFPTTVTPGSVELRNGTASPVEIYAGGSGGTRDRVVVAAHSTGSGWSVTTGTGVRVIVSVQKQ